VSALGHATKGGELNNAFHPMPSAVPRAGRHSGIFKTCPVPGVCTRPCRRRRHLKQCLSTYAGRTAAWTRRGNPTPCAGPRISASRTRHDTGPSPVLRSCSSTGPGSVTRSRVSATRHHSGFDSF